MRDQFDAKESLTSDETFATKGVEGFCHGLGVPSDVKLHWRESALIGIDSGQDAAATQLSIGHFDGTAVGKGAFKANSFPAVLFERLPMSS